MEPNEIYRIAMALHKRARERPRPTREQLLNESDDFAALHRQSDKLFDMCMREDFNPVILKFFVEQMGTSDREAAHLQVGDYMYRKFVEPLVGSQPQKPQE